MHVLFILFQNDHTRAAERLQSIVKAGPLDAMIKKIQELADEGAIDEPLVLLLETNLQQAQKADAGPAVEAS